VFKHLSYTCIKYIPHTQQLVTSCYNNKICTWQLASGVMQYRVAICDDKVQKSIFPTPHVQTALKWSPKHHKLYSGSSVGLIHSWNHFKRIEISFMKAHDDIINDLLLLEPFDCLASASSDGLIHMWDEYTFCKRQSFYGHSKGILSLAYSHSCKTLISAGYDHEALIWNPFVPELLNKLIGHRY
jgi:WD40 repeat protein